MVLYNNTPPHAVNNMTTVTPETTTAGTNPITTAGTNPSTTAGTNPSTTAGTNPSTGGREGGTSCAGRGSSWFRRQQYYLYIPLYCTGRRTRNAECRSSNIVLVGVVLGWVGSYYWRRKKSGIQERWALYSMPLPPMSHDPL